MKAIAKANLTKLVDKFERESAAGKIKDYNEEATKTAFIQPLLKDVLGWDVTSRDEVSPEEKISRGRVDYGLKVEGKIKVFVEAKPPRADLNKHIEQAVRYGYNRKSVPFVLLTDFEEFKLFDVTVKPDSRNPRKGLKIDLRWNDYLKEFDKIWLLSKESVIKGELDKLLLVKPKDRLPVDKAILDDLKRWREALAKDIFKNNPKLFSPPPSSSPTSGGRKGGGADYLKEITQRILDRIIFMRFCEDRNFVHRQPLKELFEERTETVGVNTMVFLKEEFKHYNLIFDSDLFRPQDWESNLAIDFRVMKEIVLDTYNPYQFDVIPLEVLGNIYEQYLGYTIRLTDHQVKYELKPDVRKAGGVYYTPEYIVDYIVKNTVGKLLQGLPSHSSPSFRNPKGGATEGSSTKRGISPKIKKLRILDPACGSGSFLIRAYEEMLNYYKQQKQKDYSYRRERRDSRERGTQAKLGLKEETEPRLTIEEKSQILREHIFGVDIDEQAVEVTKLSLMLKMLEGEYGIIPGRAILPMLDKNIRCGNSLISGSPLGLKDLFGEYFYKTNPFDWKETFRKIMVDEGGFDVVIGNPPYAVLSKEGFDEKIIQYLSQRFKEVTYQLDSYLLFMVQSARLSKNLIGFIIPNAYLANLKIIDFRKWLLENTSIEQIVMLPSDVFEGAVVDTTIIILSTKIEPKNKINILKYEDGKTKYLYSLSQSNFLRSPEAKINIHIEPRISKLIERILENTKPLHYYLETNRGVHAYRPDGFGKSKFSNGFQTQRDYDERSYHSKKKINDSYKIEVRGKNIFRYYHTDMREFVSYGNWLAEPRDIHFFNQPRIYVRKIVGETLYAAFSDTENIPDQSVYIGVPRKNTIINLKFFLGILNSKLMVFLFRNINNEFDILFPQIKVTEFNQLPIRDIDLSIRADKKLHDDLVALVDVMLDLKKKIQTAKGSQKEQIQRQIEKTDKEIGEIVYKLYGITEEEKKRIEGK